MDEYKLSENAYEDLEAIYVDGFINWGAAQAKKYQQGLHDQFETLAIFSGMGLPVDLHGHEFYKFPYGQHIVVYSKKNYGIRVEFVIKGCTDWLNRLRGWSN